MIARYTRPEMGALWTDAARMEYWRAVEVAACEEMEGPSAADLEAIRAASFTVEAVAERERVTDHDIAAFVDVLSASAGPGGRWIHYGLTASDVLDTALALALRAAGEIVIAGARDLTGVLVARAREHTETLCVGRTHGVHAEPTTFGIKLAGLAFEAAPQRRAARRGLRRRRGRHDLGRGRHLLGDLAGVRAAGPRAARARREDVATQVVARDRHAALLGAIALARAGLERLATEIRHLQRTEVLEAEEPFRAGEQKGSSSMPHKRNPITSERISGLARVLRGNALAALENVALWHERDISHSSVERVILPDSTILIDYMQHLATGLVRGLVVDAGRMRENLELTHGALFSQRVLLALVASGLERDEAYRIAQSTRRTLGRRGPRCASCSRWTRAPAGWTSTRSSTTRRSRATRRSSWRGWTRSRSTPRQPCCHRAGGRARANSRSAVAMRSGRAGL